MLLMTEPSGARLPRGKQTVLVTPSSPGPLGRQDHVVGIDAVALAEPLPQGLRAAATSPTTRAPRPACSPADGQGVQVQQAQLAQVEHDLGHAAGQVDAERRMVDRPVGQHVDQARHAAVHLGPVVDASAAAARRKRRSPAGAAADSSSRRRPRTRPSRCGSRRRTRMSRGA